MQLTLISGIFAVFFYLTGLGFQVMNFATNKDFRRVVFIFGIFAVITHGISASGVIRTATGYNFGIVEISTLIAVSISLLVLISSLRKPLDILFLGLFPWRLLLLSFLLLRRFAASNESERRPGQPRSVFHTRIQLYHHCRSSIGFSCLSELPTQAWPGRRTVKKIAATSGYGNLPV